MEDKATILDSGDKWLVGAKIVIDAPASEIFKLVANPHLHSQIDGSKKVRGKMIGPEKLSLGSVFFMKMKVGIPYIMKNKVVEYKENTLIGWRTLARNIWRYELKSLDNGSTEVSSWMDGRTAPKFLMKREITWAAKANAKTLVNLKNFVEGR